MKTKEILKNKVDLILNSDEYNSYIKKGKYNHYLVDIFFDQYINFIPKKYIDFLSLSDLIQFIGSRFDFFSNIHSSNQKNKQPFIKISNYRQTEGWLKESITVEVVVKDSPFLIDSIVNYFHEKKIRVQSLIHPVFNVQREENILTKVLDNSEEAIDSEDKAIAREAFFIFILEDSNIIKHEKELENKIKEIITEVFWVTNDFIKIQEEIEKIEITEIPEIEVFREWLLHDNFLFLGLSSKNSKNQNYGILRKKQNLDYYNDFNKDYDRNTFFIQRTDKISKLHRIQNIILININKNTFIIGYFSRKAEGTSIQSIPILEKKTKDIFKNQKELWTNFDVNDFVFAIDLLPIDLRFSLQKNTLIQLAEKINSARMNEKNLLNIIPENANKSKKAYIMVLWSLDEFDNEFEVNLVKAFDKLNIKLNNRTRQLLPSNVLIILDVAFSSNKFIKDIESIEEKLYKNLLKWNKRIENKIEVRYSNEKYKFFKTHILTSVPENYKYSERTRFVLKDFENLYKLNNEDNLIIRSYYDEESQQSIIKFYVKKEYSLSHIVPVLSNLGLKVLKEETFVFNILDQSIYLYKIFIEYKSKPIQDKAVFRNLNRALLAIIIEKSSSEPLNKLILDGHYNIHQVDFLKTIIAYLSQIRSDLSRDLVKNTLINNVKISQAILTFFEVHHLPNYIKKFSKNEEIQKKVREIFSNIPNNISDNIPSHVSNHILTKKENSKDKIKQYFIEQKEFIDSISFDTRIQNEIYDSLVNIIKAIKRTNLFEQDNFIALKIASGDLPYIPRPKPMVEMWIYHPFFEAVHIRGGKIARGGIRWSDRVNDFRTEITGLWKTQMVKNTVIIPTGSKGGFVLKYQDNTFENGLATYKKFMSALLEMTDNIKNGKTQVKEKYIFDDIADPYLVVAADKGTATFSDYANEISIAKDFWLKDAYASGGSHGFNHKDYGITAKGAWESFRWHFYQMKKDPANDLFTCVGIGDMSGDVFGNGMLFSDKTLLLGAFNHMFIFIDPTPDASASFKERKRMFDGSLNWDKYNKKLISKGGGIFSKNAAVIKVSKEMKSVFQIKSDILSGEKLINILLKAKVDMFFNGGIGTYVKASTEQHTDASDPGNDRVRINATELQAKIIIEGGNLGFTQLARIEASSLGHIINTDALDNSAGVDMSDHEVNIKLLIEQLIAKKIIKSQNERNALIKKSGKMVVDQVLANNFMSNNVIYNMESLPIKEQHFLLEIINRFEKMQLLKRHQENIPQDVVLHEYLKKSGKLPRPILYTLLAYTKLYIQNQIQIDTKEYEEEYLINYFPKSYIEYKDLMLKHNLKYEIVSTIMINDVVDNAGIIFFEKTASLLNLDPNKAILSYLNTIHVLDVLQLKKQLHFPDRYKRNLSSIEFDTLMFLQHLIEENIYRFIEIKEIFDKKDNIIFDMRNSLLEKYFQNNKKKYKIQLPNTINSKNKINLENLFLDIELKFVIENKISNKEKKNISLLLDCYFNKNLFLLKEALYNIEVENKWQGQALLKQKQNFWNGFLKNNQNALDKVNIKQELSKIKKNKNVNLSTISGLIAYIFE